MGIIMLRTNKSSAELMEKAHKAKKYVCELVKELEETVEEMREQYGDEENYRYDGRYDRMYRDDYENMNRRGGRYSYGRY